ncbi:MAG: Co2+/Mg2+ efflux protein ApaG [bacterium]
MDTAVTAGIEVSVDSFFLEEESEPERNHYTFAYRVRVKNLGTATVQLISRHWIITDSDGAVKEVKGDGVVGKQPVISAGEEFEYVSGSHLETPLGTMEGTYRMTGEGGELFDVKIPMFTLQVPGTLN